MSDLVKRLRHWQENCNDEYMYELAGRSADHIEALEGEINRLKDEQSQNINNLLDTIDELQAKLDALMPYIQEILDIHSDPTCAEYNECDSDPCVWCEEVIAILKQEQEDGS